ncbi:hypothetical protein TEA_019469 [Camellia sinensis var. sinensis]|uniref:Uncharacterized protein n=1 Tax=Camellia sinensis var. sinensis TaxID=542762 RepID=A0A4S4EPA8_CAMSN|nr:hypothetical protein TEA_019469 [Camellia sinensis var. sinensis]
MISAKKLVKMARKWQKFAAMRTKRISFHRNVDTASNCSTSFVADKGHFVVYSADQKHFMIPLAYLNKEITRELFKLSEAEFGLPRDGPITLPCDSIFMEYIVSLIQRGVVKDLEKALLIRKRITFSRTTGGVDNAESCNTSTVDKGHFAVYTADQKCFVIPLVYLNNDIFRVLLKMAKSMDFQGMGLSHYHVTQSSWTMQSL